MLDDNCRLKTTCLLYTSHGDELRLAGWSLLRLGSPVLDAATLQRTIDGGWLVAAPGGVLSFSCQPSSAGPVIEARLSGYSPRLPRVAYVLVQGPVHRTLVTSAVRRAVSVSYTHLAKQLNKAKSEKKIP